MKALDLIKEQVQDQESEQTCPPLKLFTSGAV